MTAKKNRIFGHNIKTYRFLRLRSKSSSFWCRLRRDEWSDGNQLKHQPNLLSNCLGSLNPDWWCWLVDYSCPKCSFIKAISREIFEVSDLIKLNARYITTREKRLCVYSATTRSCETWLATNETYDDEWTAGLRGLFWKISIKCFFDRALLLGAVGKRSTAKWSMINGSRSGRGSHRTQWHWNVGSLTPPSKPFSTIYSFRKRFPHRLAPAFLQIENSNFRFIAMILRAIFFSPSVQLREKTELNNFSMSYTHQRHSLTYWPIFRCFKLRPFDSNESWSLII